MSSSAKRPRIVGGNKKRKGNYAHFILPINDISFPLSLHKNNQKEGKSAISNLLIDSKTSLENEIDTNSKTTSFSSSSDSAPSALLQPISSFSCKSLPRKEQFYMNLVNTIHFEQQLTEKEFEEETKKTAIDFLEKELGISEVLITEPNTSLVEGASNTRKRKREKEDVDGKMGLLEKEDQDPPTLKNQEEQNDNTNTEKMTEERKKNYRKIIDIISDGVDKEERELKEEDEKPDEEVKLGESSKEEESFLEKKEAERIIAYSDLLKAGDTEEFFSIGEFDFVNPEQDRHELQKMENELERKRREYRLLNTLLKRLQFLKEKVNDYEQNKESKPKVNI